jgi:peptide/nickel transport system substrate-binding protein
MASSMHNGRLGRALVAAATLLVFVAASAAGGTEPRSGLAMHGQPALPAGFSHFPYAKPDAPKGGRLVLGIQGTFDSLNPYTVRGVAPDILPRYVLQSLMARSADEPFTMYGLVAQSLEMPADRSFIVFHLDPRARFSDGYPLTAEDVRFSFELLKTRGKPFLRESYGQVKGVSVEDERRIRFDLTGSDDRELPLLLALMPLFPAHATDAERFEETTLAPPVGSGPYVVTEVEPGSRIVLKRNPNFWAGDLPVSRGLFNFDEVRLDFYRDANSLFEAFKAGLYDFRIEGDPTRWMTGYAIPAVRDGRILREALPLRTPQGMNGFVFNTRRTLFHDVRVREALGYVLDFEWINRNLYFGALRRSASYFGASVLSASGRTADAREREILSAHPGAVREDIMEGRWSPAGSNGSGRDRDRPRQALALLGEAGWRLDGNTLRRRDTHEPFAFEVLVINRAQERLALNYAQALRRIGVRARVRLVDDVQFWRRLSDFDFDMVQWIWPVSPSPGNEQRNRWGSEAADRSGSLNLAGARSPAIDQAIDAVVAAEDIGSFEAAVRALDRVLLSGFYVVPLFYLPDQWIAYSASLGRPEVTPLFGPALETWWRSSPAAETARSRNR